MEAYFIAKLLGTLAASLAAIGFFLLVKDNKRLGRNAVAAFCLICLILILVVLGHGFGVNGQAVGFLFAGVSLFIGFGTFGIIAAVSGVSALLADWLLRRMGIAAPMWIGPVLCVVVAIALSLMLEKPFGWA